MRPKEVVAEFVARFNAADAAGLADLYVEEAVNHQVANTPVSGKPAIRAMFEAEFAAAEMVCIVENIFEDGEWAILEWRDPKGLRGCGFFHVIDGKIVLQRGYWDKLSFLKQLPDEPRPMRRKEREITDPAELREIIDGNNLAGVAMVDGVKPYAVMMNYAPVFENDEVTLLFHCARAGRKLDCLRANPAVSVFINDAGQTEIVNGGDVASHWTTHYRSVLLSGTVRLVETLPEKRTAAERFMRHYTDGRPMLTDAALDATVFFALVPEHCSGKRNPVRHGQTNEETGRKS